MSKTDVQTAGSGPEVVGLPCEEVGILVLFLTCTLSGGRALRHNFGIYAHYHGWSDTLLTEFFWELGA
jgi:hypothetical protein